QGLKRVSAQFSLIISLFPQIQRIQYISSFRQFLCCTGIINRLHYLILINNSENYQVLKYVSKYTFTQRQSHTLLNFQLKHKDQACISPPLDNIEIEINNITSQFRTC